MKKLMWFVVAVVVVGGAYWWMQTSQAPVPSDEGTTVAVGDSGASSPAGGAPAQGDTGASAAMAATVTYDGSSFSPAEVTIKKGEAVTFTSAGVAMWVASGQHPEHAGYSGTVLKEHCPDAVGAAFDQCATGNSYTFTFDKVGTWPYHNHVKLGAYGKVIVVE